MSKKVILVSFSLTQNAVLIGFIFGALTQETIFYNILAEMSKKYFSFYHCSSVFPSFAEDHILKPIIKLNSLHESPTTIIANKHSLLCMLICLQYTLLWNIVEKTEKQKRKKKKRGEKKNAF